jgi:hypothetical protein
MRKTYEPWVAERVGKLEGVEKGAGDGCFTYTTDSAEEVGNLLNKVEWVVLKP